MTKTEVMINERSARVACAIADRVRTGEYTDGSGVYLLDIVAFAGLKVANVRNVRHIPRIAQMICGKVVGADVPGINNSVMYHLKWYPNITKIAVIFITPSSTTPYTPPHS